MKLVEKGLWPGHAGAMPCLSPVKGWSSPGEVGRKGCLSIEAPSSLSIICKSPVSPPIRDISSFCQFYACILLVLFVFLVLMANINLYF